ncbi:MAG: ATP-binding protein [Candidatus Cryosericum sp.]
MSPVTREMIQKWLTQPEDEHLEFKSARNSLNHDEIGRYCSALSNVGGGYLVLGISDKVPRQVVGTTAFDGASLAVLKNYLFDQLHSITVEAEIVPYDHKEIIIFSVPARPRPCCYLQGNCVHTYW